LREGHSAGWATVHFCAVSFFAGCLELGIRSGGPV
jgi:hypothetical protein